MNAVSDESVDVQSSPVASAKRDLVTGGIVVAAILLFVGLGGTIAHSVVNVLAGIGGGTDQVLASALLLNIALILFGWRRYRDLSREVANRAATEDRVQTLASRDPLTGLLNRRSFGEAAASLIARAEKRHKAVAMLVIDLDQFKTVNDLHSHVVGDQLLRAAAAAIEEAAPPNAVYARLGGDEFGCAFPFNPSDPGSVDLVAERLIAGFAEPFRLGDVHAHVTASAGIACVQADCPDFDGLIRRADIAMYAAKKQGRNRFAWFDASMERELHMRNSIEAGLRVGIPAGEIVPYYEQQIDLMTGRIHGFEVLARWQHPTRGIVAPDIFIPIAEEAGLIGELSLSVMRQAFEEAKYWDPSLTLSVNISPGQLKDPWLAQKIVKLLVETGYPANRLEIEITESSLFENLGLAQSIVASLKNQGIRLALDDFGTGYSSLAHLRALPFDRIKIDKSFVSSMVENSESAAIVTAITKLGDSLGLPITAEGIEDSEIEERLRAIGCHKGQGWHFGKPMSLNQVRKFLAAQSLLPRARETSAIEDFRSVRRVG
jgi:diguanylate cyclase (GGDEF)-like protein